MHKHPILSFCIGLVLCGLVLGSVSFLLIVLTVNLAGGETLRQTENTRTALLIITLILLVFASVLVRSFYKEGKKFTAFGIAVLPIVVTIINTVYYVENINFHTEYNKAVWKQMKWKPFGMSATLVKEKKLIGLTRTQVEDMLGKTSEDYVTSNDDKNSVYYFVENDWTLIISCKEDRVVNTELRQPFLGV